MGKIEQTTKKYTIRKSKGNPNHCPICGKFLKKK